MGWLHCLSKLWRSTMSCFLPQHQGLTFEKLSQDVQECSYEDVQVLWSILHNPPHISPQRSKGLRKPWQN
ncbi:hypothetical protein KP509_17G056300 [Ceratopteris richardii]|uniref:Uncharacterized protein n=1 Tax=Ceratopteris richardii TaxID=49495 RepID=A0A8T2SY09_CERRI|nr:hypothetical protein KP509_17G056300 [Ceratopteris richardii]